MIKEIVLLVLLFTGFAHAQPFDSDHYKDLFEQQWTASDSLARFNQAELPCNVGVGSSRCEQEMYYTGWAWDSLLSMYRLTGEVTYLNQALDLFFIYIDKSTVLTISSDTYIGWPVRNPANSSDVPNGSTLFESYGLKYIATFTRVIMNDDALLDTAHGSPGSVTWTGTTYRDVFDYLVDFLEHDLFEKFEAQGWGNIYRSLVHMTSHWARISKELYLITGKQKYRDVYDNIVTVGYPSGLGLTSTRVGEHFSKMDYYTGTNYQWEYDMDNNQVQIQDTNHAIDVFEMYIEAYYAGLRFNEDFYYDATIMEGIKETGLNYLFLSTASHARDTFVNIDGSGGTKNDMAIAGWVLVGGVEPEALTFMANNHTALSDLDPSSGNNRRTQLAANTAYAFGLNEDIAFYGLTADLTSNIPLIERRLKKDSQSIGF